MKVLLSTDPHAKLSNLDSFVCYLSKLRELESQVDIAIIAGDLFNDHALIRSELMSYWLEFFGSVKIPYYLVVGNHDKISPSSTVHALEAFKFIPKINVTAPHEVRLVGPNNEFAIIAHNSYDIIKELLGPAGHGKYLVCHNIFNGTQFDNGMYAPEGIPLEWVSKFQLVIAGDCHKEQQIGNVWYPGSPFAMNFADAGQEKGVWIFDTETQIRTKIKLDLPQYIVQSFQGVDKIIPWIITQSDKNKFRVSVLDVKNNIQLFQASKPWREIREKYSITMVPQYIDIIEYSSKISDTLSPVQMLEKYILDVMQINGIDRARLLRESSAYLKNN